MENHDVNVAPLPLLVQSSPGFAVPSRIVLVDRNTTFGRIKLSLLPSDIASQIVDSLYFSINGKPLGDSSTLLSSGITKPFANLTLRVRALGGGGDGGSTCAESRDCYLNMYAVKKPDKVDPNEARLSRWTNCALSFEPLKPPCVIDKLGNVFNKEPLVEALLGKKLPKAFGDHIKGLKDMIPIQLSPRADPDDDVRFKCPITDLEFNGKYKFFALRGCGHVLSAKALKEVKSSGCLVCHAEFSESDKIVINGSAEEVALLREKMDAERANSKLLREKKKIKAVDGVEAVPRISGTKHGFSEKTPDEKVLVKAEVNGKLQVNAVVDGKGNGNGAIKRHKSSAVVIPPNATKEVYASIFTSSKKTDFKETYMCRSLPLGRN